MKSSSDEITSIIICIHDGSSYDNIFRKFSSETQRKDKMLVYNVSYDKMNRLVSSLKNIVSSNIDEYIDQIKHNIEMVDHSNVVFYYECCSACENYQIEHDKYHFPNIETIGNISFLIREKHFMVICGDFSLKSLICDWNVELLGKKPFYITGSTSGMLTLLFDRETLNNSSSEQLKLVGSLSSSDSLIVDSLPGTIVYNVNDLTDETDLPYSLEVLTVVKDEQNKYQHCETIDGNYDGTAGHCILKYNEGGMLMTSNCHFIELLKIDTSIETIVEHARDMYGEDYSQRIEDELRSAPTETLRNDSMTSYIVRMVSDTTPSAKKYKSNKSIKLLL